MAVIGKIRSYSGLLIAVIGIALVAFVLGDFLGYGPTRGQTVEVGAVGSSRIVYHEFENRVAQAMENWRNQSGVAQPGAREAFQIRQQVWEQMLRELLLAREYDELGLKISPEELTELVIGNDPHPAIIQSFSNPADGSFNPQTVMEFIQNMSMMDPSMQQQWFMLEDYIRDQRKETKYHTLIRKGFYVPDALARADFEEKNAMADVRLISKRFSDIPDSLARVTERDLRRVYNQHKQRFKRDASRDLEYVVLPIFASEQDRDRIEQDITRLKQEFITTDNPETFVNTNSDQRFSPVFLSSNELSPELESELFNAEPGAVYGPFVENNAFVVARLVSAQQRPDSMSASHILISFLGSRAATPTTVITRDQAREKADSILGVVRRSPNTFAALASELSEDPSAITNQGDLGWFPDGAMVPGFNEAVINTPVNNFTVAESEFGFHVIRVTGKSAPTRKVQIARLVREIDYSNHTFQRVYGQASSFATDLRNNDDFDQVAGDHGLSKRIIDVTPMDNAIPGIDHPRGIIQWAFAERTREGSISPIFDLDGRFVVARVAAVKEEGVPSLDEIRNEIMAIAINEKKADIIKNEFNQLQGLSLDQKSDRLAIEIRTVENVRFASNNLIGFGAEPAVVGSIFALEPNTISAPVKGNNAVFVFEVISREPVVEPSDLTMQQMQLMNNFRNRVPSETYRALRESAEIKDNRHMFY
jgi:peptidyl-prolyl cis-trans isomerase D